MAPPNETEPLLNAELRQLLARLKLALRRARGAAGEGRRRASGRAGRQEFADFRDYEPGDDLRDLDWSAYARLEKLFIKEYAAHSTEPITLLLDTSASMACANKWRFARRLVIALAFLSLLGRHKVRILLIGPNRWLGPYEGAEKIEALAARLQTATTTTQEDLGAALRSQSRSLSRRGRYWLISDLWTVDPLPQAILEAQGVGRGWTLLHVLSAQELAPSLDGPLRLCDAEGGPPAELQIDASLRAAYQRALEAHLTHWQTFCQRYRLRYVLLDTRRQLEASLLAELRTGGLVE